MPIKEKLKLYLHLNWAIIGAMLALSVAGVFAIYSASYRGDDQPMPTFYIWQMRWIAIGIVVFLVMIWIDYEVLARWSWLIFAAVLGLLILVLIVGKISYGARSWFGFGGRGIQPAELAKLAVALMISFFLSRQSRDVEKLSTMIKCFAIIIVPILLVLAQPDLGSAAVLVPMTLTMMFVAGVRVRYFVMLFAIGIALAPIAWLGLHDYQKERLLVFIDPDRDPLRRGWNLHQSLIAVGSGGWDGKGWLEGTQNVLGYLPKTVAPNDFIFSVIAEEKGFLGCLVVLALYGVILFEGVRIAGNAKDKLGMILAAGLTAMLFTHIFQNIGMTIGLMPITGLPLPLLSYGGSFMLLVMATLGLLQNVYIRRKQY
ncbi:MAG: rod shape-determining protein RodA [Verrucomicrobiae bacterium]|nr:rod shape-determining protein RodA [Verrucomicrobiae bacterium]